MTNHSTQAGALKPWTAPRLESLDVAATLAGNQSGKENAGTGGSNKTFVS